MNPDDFPAPKDGFVITHFLVVSDQDRSRDFYQSLLGGQVLMERDQRITLEVQNMENPYEYAEIRGRVAERTREGADEHIDSMAKKYLGQDTYPYRQPGEQRLIIRVEPEYVKVMGG